MLHQLHDFIYSAPRYNLWTPTTRTNLQSEKMNILHTFSGEVLK